MYKIAGKRIAIVEDTPGVTRDRIYADAEWLNYRFTLIATKGFIIYAFLSIRLIISSIKS